MGTGRQFMPCGECYGQIVCTVNVQEKPWNMTYYRGG
jgi:hypothetical protein